MNAPEKQMTAWEAAGYILGVGVGLVWRYYRFVLILLACALLLLIRVRITYQLPTDDSGWTVGLIEGVFLGVALLAGGIALWSLRRRPKT